MEKFKDIWASIVSQIHERTTNPLTFSFVVSWLIWNYRFVLIAISELPIKEKIEFINSIYPDWIIVWREGIFYPLSTALLYVFVYPFITEIAVNFYRNRQVILANSIKNIERQRLLTKEEATGLQRRHEKMLTKASEAEMELQAELKVLRESLQSAEEEINSLRLKLNPKVVLEVDNSTIANSMHPTEAKEDDIEIIEIDNQNLSLDNSVPGVNLKNNSLTKRQLRILSILSDGNRVSIKDIAADFSIRKFFVDFDLDVLRGLELIFNSGIGNTEYQITALGRVALNAFIAQNIWKLDSKAV